MELEMRTYKNAIKLLNGLQSNASIIKDISKDKRSMFQLSLPEMKTYLNLIGYKPENLDSLKLIHITGTKGKGSTAAFVNNLLYTYPNKKLKVGLFTSPHLIEVRERIRIDNVPLQQEKFSQYFFEIYDKLINKDVSQIHPHLPGPSYFRFLTLLAFHTFMREKVDATILEVGIGGEYDSTNIIQNPVACGIAHLGIDHVNLLGDTVESIAWHKAGIMKKGCPAFIIPQQSPSALKVVEERKVEIGTELTVVEPLSKFSNYSQLQLRLSGDHQLVNASLAYRLYRAYLHHQRLPPTEPDGTSLLSDTTVEALNGTQWVGRSYQYQKFHVDWYLDGAHTETSLHPVLHWFQKVKANHKQTYLLFNPANGRDFEAFWKVIQQQSHQLHIQFDHIFLTPNVRGGESGDDQTNFTVEPDLELKLQHQIKDLIQKSWKGIKVTVFPTIYAAIHDGILEKVVESDTFAPQVLVTGSLHLVGGVLSVLDHPVI